VFKKENGKYARFAVCMLCEHGYQSRVGVITAGNYGVPQGRRRVFFWGARSGLEQLPAFPEPSHHLVNFNTGFSKGAERCVVGFLVRLRWRRWL
jgi:DNA (cytosine-5)-methyltransferase 1